MISLFYSQLQSIFFIEMIKISHLILFILSFCAGTFSQNCGKAKGGIGNVIGGSEFERNEYPW
jgi:hypothetical protein